MHPSDAAGKCKWNLRDLVKIIVVPMAVSAMQQQGREFE